MTPPRGSAVLGLGGGIDYEVRLVGATLAELAGALGIGPADLDRRGPLETERDLVASVLGYLRAGRGGEHFVASPEVLTRFAHRFPHRITLGGTSVRAGIVMDRLGVGSTLHLVTVNDVVRRLLPAGVGYRCSDATDTFYPHLVVQYGAGLEVRTADLDLTAPAANRLIYVNDPANERLALADDLGDLLSGAPVLLLSGFNAMRDRDLLQARLADLRRHLARLPATALVYFEDAGYHEPEFSARVRAALLDRIDVYGLNEDELQAHLGRRVDLLDAAHVRDALLEARRLLPGPTLVLHTRYWALALGDRAEQWRAALDTAVAVAATRYARGDDLDPADCAALLAGPRGEAATAFAAALTALLPGRVECRAGFVLDVAEPTTVGLGDSFVGGFLAAVAGRPVAPATAAAPV